jgi:hypothetical protein
MLNVTPVKIDVGEDPFGEYQPQATRKGFERLVPHRPGITPGQRLSQQGFDFLTGTTDRKTQKAPCP